MVEVETCFLSDLCWVMPIKLKGRFYKTMIKPVVTYGVEILTNQEATYA